MPDENGFMTKQEKKERLQRLTAEAEACGNAAVFASGGDTGVSSEIRRSAQDRYWRNIAPTR
jgi:hypothetical protein